MLTTKQKNLLRSAFRTTLRKFADPRRTTVETFVDWVQRATSKVHAMAKRYNIQDRQEKHLRLKWEWAGHVVRMDHRRWSRRTLLWKGEDSFATTAARASVGRPRLRWEDELDAFANAKGWTSWQIVARNWSTAEWNKCRHDFVHFILKEDVIS